MPAKALVMAMIFVVAVVQQLTVWVVRSGFGGSCKTACFSKSSPPNRIHNSNNKGDLLSDVVVYVTMNRSGGRNDRFNYVNYGNYPPQPPFVQMNSSGGQINSSGGPNDQYGFGNYPPQNRNWGLLPSQPQLNYGGDWGPPPLLLIVLTN